MTNLCTPTVEFLTLASVDAVINYLTEDVVLAEQGHDAMNWLLEHRPSIANAALAQLYAVACYQVGNSCFKDEAPEDEHDKWFVSTLVGTFPQTGDIPLADSEEQAISFAVRDLKLKELFFSTEEQVAHAEEAMA